MMTSLLRSSRPPNSILVINDDVMLWIGRPEPSIFEQEPLHLFLYDQK